MNHVEAAIAKVLPGVFSDASTAPQTSSHREVTEGRRNAHLTSLAGSMRRRGMTPEAIAAALAEENRRRCHPALDASEVEGIARSVGRYAPNGDDPVVFSLWPPRAMTAAEAMQAPAIGEIVEGLLYADALTVLVSESGAGKTFTALDVAGAIADGVPWHGRDVQLGSVVYLPFEGALKYRLQALHHVVGRRLQHLYVLPSTEPLSPRVTREGEHRSVGELQVCASLEALREELADTKLPPITAIMIDTVRAAMTGSEDTSDAVSAFLRAVRRVLATVPGAAALLVHHSGWQDGEAARKRERGSSAWRGNCDVTVYLEAGDYDGDTGTCPLTIRTLKTRDGENPPPLQLVRRRVVLAECDRHGRPVTSCVIEADMRTRADVEAKAHATVKAADHALDLRVLRAMHAHENATSAHKLRAYAGVGYQAVQAAITRIVNAGWARPGGRGQPYEVTLEGLALLEAN